MSNTTTSDSADSANVVSSKKVPTFEEAMARLEEIVAELQQEDLPLEKAFALWEEGQRLHAHCTAILNNLKKRLEASQKARTDTVEDDK